MKQRHFTCCTKANKSCSRQEHKTPNKDKRVGVSGKSLGLEFIEHSNDKTNLKVVY